MLGFIVIAFLGYIVYIRGIRPSVIRRKFTEEKLKLEVEQAFDTLSLHNELIQRNFTFPEMKNLRINQHQQVVIEGKYSAHPITIKDRQLYVGRGERGGDQKATKCILEANIILNYLKKFFNPLAPVDPYEEFKKYKLRRKQPTFVTLIATVAFIIAIAMNGGDQAVKDATAGLSSNNISTSYLSQYSSNITIGEAFNNFFGDPKWKSYDQGIEKYVDFQGKITFDNEPATATVTFWLSDEQFIVERIKINNSELLPVEIDEFLQVVYEESK